MNPSEQSIQIITSIETILKEGVYAYCPKSIHVKPEIEYKKAHERLCIEMADRIIGTISDMNEMPILFINGEWQDAQTVWEEVKQHIVKHFQ